MNELKPEDVMKKLELQVQRHLMPNVDIDGTVSVENAERWFLKLLKEELAPYVSALLREKDAKIERLKQENKDLHDNIDVIIEMVAIARAEAITEFEDRLKQASYADCTITGYRHFIVDIKDIDQIAKEMKEDSDGSDGVH